ncbi:MAG: hypothetical protein ACE5NA_02390 [Nitrospiraceae bacterium]
MKRFRSKSLSKRPRVRSSAHAHAGRRGVPADAERWERKARAQWKALDRVCTDLDSRARLTQLIKRLTGSDRGSRESALAELELATQLLRVGFHVGFLPESQARTADLECARGEERFFVEVTALVGSARRSVRSSPLREWSRNGEDDDGVEQDGQTLLRRLLARISQKARQLGHYQASVLLAISVPRQDATFRVHPEACDLKRVAAGITMLLPRLKQLSAVLLALWDVNPLPERSGVRLANVHIVERAKHQVAYPRVRLLILNPGAAVPLREVEVESLKGLL